MTMTGTTLGEQLLLLSLDDTTGQSRLPLQTSFAIGAAALLERALAEDTALPDDAGQWIHRHRTEEYETALQGLLAKGLIRKEEHRVLLFFRTTRYPEADGTEESSVRSRLTDVVLNGATPDHRTAALITLLHHNGLQSLAFPDAESDKTARRTTDQRMQEIAEHHWADPALRSMSETAAATVAALMAATVAATVVVTAIT
ncbi:GOLPH3/VPS74 family protein [Streptomyces graminofaciens]|nr:GPP34 family phosphoprotein [Streptomyces graminofaciens]